mmetsp:Transcript_4810/g.11797  ORF Transcript_4810/g.11797 Transcript_4810/m.11797 type:complete len:142 (-) Transcript_4810:1251-1676(-)
MSVYERALLARNDTVAQYVGVTHRPCRFLTSLCPNNCGHAADTADFKILKYLVYERPGQYGDDQSEMFYFDLKTGQGRGPAKATQEEYAAKCAQLKPGDHVKLNWLHEYVTDGGSKFPERPVTLLEPISDEEATSLAGGSA